ncbi:ComF family protein [Emcibacter sp. SYSU 3D8]|uniref:ComF family protein n=1 Tax=Emcibacter sp. SYSU 3D8 TaxID=3133969 RepID=UPI0031FF0331
MLGTVSQFGRHVLDAVFPPQCPVCAVLVQDHAQLCPACWGQVRFIGAPYCACCGVSLEFDAGGDALCLQCLTDRPAFDRARSVMVYDDFSRSLVLRFKHGDRLDTAPVFARWMARAGRELLDEADIIAPVPLHWTRLLARRFNQSAILARHIARPGGPDFVPDLLSRIRRTPSQGALGRKERSRNVRGAFALSPRYGNMVKGRRVVLVDDVLTTGATVGHCARALRSAGAGRVDVLTLARVALPDQAAI